MKHNQILQKMTNQTKKTPKQNFFSINFEANIQTVFNPIDGVNDSVVDIRLVEDETKLKAEITDNLPDFADNVDHSSEENVETEARNKDDVLNNAIVELIGNNAIFIDTKVDMELNENET